MVRTKLGLALSGGGFRASLFHIGVLARLAELDLLRKVEVLSTVSGGSIIGAYYYLKVKQLFENKRPDGLTPSTDAYVKIVQEIETDFLAAVQTNLRMQALLNPYKNARMLMSDDYSRSDRMAELYNKKLFVPLWLNMKDREQSDDILLSDIKISPAGLQPGFNLEQYNAAPANSNKVPVLTINATALNTGHSWHFTSSWMGEPAYQSQLGPSLDTNYVLPQLRFDGAPRNNVAPTPGQLKTLQTMKLCEAVAASAAVPGIFHPFAIHDLYQSGTGKEIVVELVDGGVYDNQGMDTLIVAGCTDIIGSDASGQLEDELAPPSKFYAVIMRSSDILMDRVRDQGYYETYLRERVEKLNPAGAGVPAGREIAPQCFVNKFAFFHLREAFPAVTGYPAIPGPVDRSDGTNGHVYRLSTLRTDLDAFSDLEACTLMYDGFCLSDQALVRAGFIAGTQALPQRNSPGKAWGFMRIGPVLTNQPAKLLKHLTVGKQLFFKVFRLGDFWAWAAAAAFAALLLRIVYLTRDVSLLAFSADSVEFFGGALTFGMPGVTVGYAFAAILVLVAATMIAKLADSKPMRWLLKAARTLRRGHAAFPLYIVVGVLMVISSGIAFIYLLIFNRRFLRAGRID